MSCLDLSCLDLSCLDLSCLVLPVLYGDEEYGGETLVREENNFFDDMLGVLDVHVIVDQIS